MNISIDDKVLSNLKTADGQKLDINELLVCMIILMNENPTDVTQRLLNRGVLIKDNNTQQLHVFRKYIDLVEGVLLASDKAVPTLSSLDELVNKLQELFPKERKLDSHGQPRYSYRGNKRDVTERLQKFFKLYGKYSYDDVLECTKRYVERFKYDKTNMRLLPYFIMKTVDGELVSDLATELDNMDTDETTQSNNDLNYGDMLL